MSIARAEPRCEEPYLARPPLGHATHSFGAKAVTGPLSRCAPPAIRYYLERGRGARNRESGRRQECIALLRRMLATPDAAPLLLAARQRLALAEGLQRRLAAASCAFVLGRGPAYGMRCTFLLVLPLSPENRGGGQRPTLRRRWYLRGLWRVRPTRWSGAGAACNRTMDRA